MERTRLERRLYHLSGQRLLKLCRECRSEARKAAEALNEGCPTPGIWMAHRRLWLGSLKRYQEQLVTLRRIYQEG